MRIKKQIKKVLFLLSALVVVLLMQFSASADMVTKDGLTAEIVTDNNYYNSGDIAQVIIKVTNNNEFKVTNVSLESIIPEGLVIAEDSNSTAKVSELDAGETLKLSVSVIQKEVPLKDDRDNNSTSSLLDSSSSSTAKDSSLSEGTDKTTNLGSVNNQVNNVTANSTVTYQQTSTSNEKNTYYPNTGDTRTSLIIGLVILFMILLIFVICYNRKHFIKSLSLILVVFLCGGIISDIKVAADSGIDYFVFYEQLRFEDNVYDFSAKATYDDVIISDDDTYTRSEWVKLISETEGITLDYLNVDTEDYDFFYGDTHEMEDGLIYEYVHAIGALPSPDNDGYIDPEQDVPLFEPDKIVTREYAVYSAIKILGFEDETPALNCSDVSLLTYPSAVSIALKFDMIGLVGNEFKPNDALSKTDGNQIIAVMKAFNSATTVDDDEKVHKINFKDEVISKEFADITNYSVSSFDGANYSVVLPLNDASNKLAEGNIFVLPESTEFPNGTVFKVSSVSGNKDTVTVVCTIPETEEVVESVYLQDTFAVSFEDFVPEDGVFAEVVDSKEKSGDAAPLDLDEKWNTPDTKLKLSTTIDDKIKVEVALGMPSITLKYKSHWQWGWPPYVIDEAMFAPNITSDISVSYLLDNAEESKWLDFESYRSPKWNKTHKDVKLGKVPVTLPAGFCAWINVYLSANIEGKITLEFDIDLTPGFHYVNGSKRNIKSAQINFNKIEIAAEGKVGPKVGLNLQWAVLPDLIGAEVFGGAAFKTSIALHPTVPLVCDDIRTYLFLDLGLAKETVLGNLISSEATIELLNEDNSPLKLPFHMEISKSGIAIVDECTYGQGRLVLYVSDSGNNPITSTKVTLYNEDGSFAKCGYTDSNGRILLTKLDAGNIKISIKATGYKMFTSTETIKPREETYAEVVLMVEREDDNKETTEGIGINYVTGTIKDAITGAAIDANYVVRKRSALGLDDDIVASGNSENGIYKVTLPCGYYTITFSKDGYLDNSVNASVNAVSFTEKNVVISPKLSGVDKEADLRIVLTWGNTPSDLDSHLLSRESSEYHIYFRDKSYSRSSNVVANLDVDDTDGNGPETITIYTMNENDRFSYYVHDYTNKSNSNSTSMSKSGAKVVVYSGDNVVAVYNTPINVEGNLWHVFDYDPTTMTISPINIYSVISSSEFSEYYIDQY